MPEVSIIVPVYNVEKYLKRCIDSILAQTFKNFELILVDDGSSDSSGMICDKYAEKDSRIQVVHAINSGVSAARNKGIKMSAGNYILFCDSDDIVHPQWCEKLLRLARKNQDKLCVCNLTRDYGEFKQIRELQIDNGMGVEIDYYELYKRGVSPYVVNKIFSSKIIKSNNIMFDEKVKMSEDVVFVVDYLKYCKAICYKDISLYYYYQNNGGAMQRYDPNRFEMHFLPFSYRLQMIDENHMQEYCDIWLNVFVSLFNNVFDEKNSMSFMQKMKYNNKMIKSKEFKYCLEHSSGLQETKLVMRVLRGQNYYIYWILNTMVQLKSKLWNKIHYWHSKQR